MGAIFSSIFGGGNSHTPPPPPSASMPPPSANAGIPLGSPTLPNGAWDDGPEGNYGPKGLGVGLKKGETMTIDPSSSQVLNPSLTQKAMIGFSNFTQGKGWSTETNPQKKVTFVGTDDPYAPKVYTEGDKGFVDYSRGTKPGPAGNPIHLPGGSAFDENGKMRPEAFVDMGGGKDYKGAGAGGQHKWDMQQQILDWYQRGKLDPGGPAYLWAQRQLGQDPRQKSLLMSIPSNNR